MAKQQDRSERKKQRKKKRAKNSLFGMLAGLIAFLIATFSGFLGLDPVGIYPDGSGSHSLIREASEPEDAQAPVEMADEQTADQAALETIYVIDDGYEYMGQSYDLTGITEIIEGLKATGPIELVDQLADVKAFEDVEEVLNAAGIDYSITEDYE